MQREGAAERTPFEHWLPFPSNQRNDDQVQARGYYGISRIAALRWWRDEADESAATQTGEAAPIFDLTVLAIRYKLGDITAFLESQPGGGGAAKPSNPPTRRPRATTPIFDLTVVAT